MGEMKQEWIEGLRSPDAAARGTAASQIYAYGRARADRATHSWWGSAEFARWCGSAPNLTVGLAVRPETFAAIRKANDWPKLAKVPAEQDASEFELHFDGAISLDVLTSREPGGTGVIARFLATKGEGVQQVEIRCGDVDRATEILRDEFGVAAVYPETRPGADGTRVNFFLVESADGKKLLIELYQTQQAQA